MTFKIAADKLLSLGFSVIPVRPSSKAPLLGALSRTRDPHQVSEWAAAYPDANVGIVSDEEFTILETDDSAGFLAVIEAETGMAPPPTACITSGRPNRCAWIYRRTPACGSDCLEVPGIFEFRNRNQYILGPGSVHPDGLVYHWLDEREGVAIPDWLVEALKRLDAAYKGRGANAHVKTGPAERLKAAYMGRLDPQDMLTLDGLAIEANERHYTLLSIAGLLHDGERTEEEITEILGQVRDAYCDAPEEKGNDELRRIAFHVIKREPFCAEPLNLPAYHLGLKIFISAEAMATWVAENIDALDIMPKPERKPATDWKSIFHTWVEFESAPPVTFAIEGFLQNDGITMLGGLPSHGKSLVAMSTVRALCTGRALFGHSAFAVHRKADRVIYLLPEAGLAQLKKRVEMLRLTEFVKSGVLLTRTMNSPEHVSLVDPRMIEAARGAHVILDTAIRFMSGDENSSGEQRAFSRTLFELLAAGAKTVIGVHHSPKHFESANHMTLENVLRGAGDLGAMLSTCWGLRQTDEKSNEIFVKNVKSRDFAPVDPFVLTGRPFIDESGDFAMTEQPGSAGDMRDRINIGRPSIISEYMGDQILEEAARGDSFRAIGARHGISHQTVARFVVRKVRKP